MLTKFDKALAPVVVAVVLALLSRVGISSDMSINQVVSLLVTAGLVYLVPNKQ